MMRVLRRLLAVILVIVGAVAAGALIPLPLWSQAAEDTGGETRRILVLSNPIHTDIAIPLDADTRAAFAFLERSGVPVAEPGARWMIIGWGGRAFYLETPTWADLKPMPVFRALTVDSSVLHVDVTGELDEGHPAVTALDVGAAEFEQLQVFIRQSFAQAPDAVAAIADAGYGPYDRFFEAKGAFNALIGCNTWTAQALRAAGVRTGLWNPLPQTLTFSLTLFN
ncbi:MAG: TIGR02117 family protein [Alphaproteobacteria bacterium]|nr:TIGR02117 family protein [Alphaproteobacteria bacterium]MBU1548890.1 TIGR02117 family protein [Alphaproteobacteria bacterium]MBU2335716.1 TIGR02117 family protein [Alphaproteobacteria bacterium]MBU2390889.1 TIGR02117 family protein [Alphaproteobacteria bacterium]